LQQSAKSFTPAAAAGVFTAAAAAPRLFLLASFEGEDLPLYDFEISYKGGLKNKCCTPASLEQHTSWRRGR
jgi:hypothetical protein